MLGTQQPFPNPENWFGGPCKAPKTKQNTPKPPPDPKKTPKPRFLGPENLKKQPQTLSKGHLEAAVELPVLLNFAVAHHWGAPAKCECAWA